MRISRVQVRPPAVTVTRAPIPSRLLTVPSGRTAIQWPERWL